MAAKKRFRPGVPSTPKPPFPDRNNEALEEIRDEKHGRKLKLVDTISLDWEPRQKDVDRALGRSDNRS
jgi:hypothetical protein